MLHVVTTFTLLVATSMQCEHARALTQHCDCVPVLWLHHVYNPPLAITHDHLQEITCE
jgi:hypothetical protein